MRGGGGGMPVWFTRRPHANLQRCVYADEHKRGGDDETEARRRSHEGNQICDVRDLIVGKSLIQTYVSGCLLVHNPPLFTLSQDFMMQVSSFEYRSGCSVTLGGGGGVAL